MWTMHKCLPFSPFRGSKTVQCDLVLFPKYTTLGVWHRRQEMTSGAVCRISGRLYWKWPLRSDWSTCDPLRAECSSNEIGDTNVYFRETSRVLARLFTLLSRLFLFARLFQFLNEAFQNLSRLFTGWRDRRCFYKAFCLKGATRHAKY